MSESFRYFAGKKISVENSRFRCTTGTTFYKHPCEGDEIMNEIDILAPFLSESRKRKIAEVLDRRTRSLTVVVCRLNKPHNYMAIFRSCEAMGLQDVHVVLGEGSPGRINRDITQGADKWLSVTYWSDVATCLEALRARGYVILAGGLSDGAKPLESHGFHRPVALVMGNELLGLDEREMALCDGLFTLPMKGFTQSYNVSVATALALQKAEGLLEKNEVLTGLTDAEKLTLTRRWYKLSVKHADAILKQSISSN